MLVPVALRPPESFQALPFENLHLLHRRATQTLGRDGSDVFSERHSLVDRNEPVRLLPFAQGMRPDPKLAQAIATPGQST